MKKTLVLLPLFIFCISCKMGETDKAVPINESEELNIGEKKHATDSNVVVDTLHH